MRTIELTDEQKDSNFDEGDPVFMSVDWKTSGDQVLALIDEQLEAFGLEIVQFDTGSDEYMWKIEKRQAVDAQGGWR